MRWMSRGLMALVIAAPVSAQSPRTLDGVPQSGRSAFEVVSIKPVSRDAYPVGIEEENPCSGSLGRLTGRTLVAQASTLYALIALAYNPWKQAPRACELTTTAELISGGPDWINSARYSIQALFPEGADTGSYDRLLNTGEGTDAQRMLQTMLEDRFKLTLRRATRELPVYLLTADQSRSVAQTRMAQSAKTGYAISEPLRAMGTIFTNNPTGPDGMRYVSISFVKQPLVRLAHRLATVSGRPVLDRTGLDGVFDFILEYDNSGAARPSVFTAIREQLGLRLDVTLVPFRNSR